MSVTCSFYFSLPTFIIDLLFGRLMNVKAVQGPLTGGGGAEYCAGCELLSSDCSSRSLLQVLFIYLCCISIVCSADVYTCEWYFYGPFC